MEWRETILKELNELRVEYELLKSFEKLLRNKTNSEITLVSLSLISRKIYELENVLKEG